RLEREFGALSTLRQQGIERVPRPLLRDDARYYGVYSREPGAVRPASTYTAELAGQLGRWAATLTRVRPDGPDRPLAVGAALSLAERVERVRAQISAFRARAADPGAPAAVRALCDEMDPVAAVERSIAR